MAMFQKTRNNINLTDHAHQVYWRLATPASLVALPPAFESRDSWAPYAGQYFTLMTATRMAQQTPIAKDARILDVACGGGQMGLAAAMSAGSSEQPKLANTYFIDITDQTEAMGSLYSQDRIKSHFLQVDFRMGDIKTRLKNAFGHEQYDHVFFKQCLHMFTAATQARAIQHLLTLVTPGGQLHFDYAPPSPPGLERACASFPEIKMAGSWVKTTPVASADGIYSILNFVNTTRMERQEVHAFGAVDQDYCTAAVTDLLRPTVAAGHTIVKRKLWDHPDPMVKDDHTADFERAFSETMRAAGQQHRDMAHREAVRRCFMPSMALDCAATARVRHNDFRNPQAITESRPFAWAVVITKKP